MPANAAPTFLRTCDSRQWVCGAVVCRRRHRLLAELEARLLDEFLNGDEDAAVQFKALATPLVLAFTRRFGPDLAASLLDDVVAETWLILVEGGRNRFDVDRGTGHLKNYLFYVVKRAVQRVRAHNAKPGHRTRYRRDLVQERNVVSIDCLMQGPLDARAHDAFRGIQARHDAAAILADAPSAVAFALIAVHIRDRTLSDVARQLGISRFRITRAMAAFKERVRSQQAA